MPCVPARAQCPQDLGCNAYVNSLGVGIAVPGATLHVTSSGVEQCCAPTPPPAALTEDPGATGRQAWLQFHNRGEAEGYIRLSGGGPPGSGRERIRRFEIGQTNSTSINLNLNVAGRVGIDGTGNPAAALQVPNFSGPGGEVVANRFVTYSSRTWKQNVTPIDDALARVRRLRGVYFDWKKTQNHDVGLIAEEVASVVPEAVTYEPNAKDIHFVDYGRLTPLLVEAVKQLRAQVEELRSENQVLQRRIRKLETN